MPWKKLDWVTLYNLPNPRTISHSINSHWVNQVKYLIYIHFILLHIAVIIILIISTIVISITIIMIIAVMIVTKSIIFKAPFN